MKYLGVVWAAIRALILMGAVGWLLLLLRGKVMHGALLPWSIFTALGGSAIGIAFAWGMKGLVAELRMLKNLESDKPDQNQ